jgi:hypothetical protein
MALKHLSEVASMGREAGREYKAHYTAANNRSLSMDIYDQVLSEDNRRATKLH